MPPTSLTLAGLNTRPDAESNASAVIEGGVVGQENILRQEFAFERGQPLAQRRFAVGEFPVPGHGVDAEQICRLDGVGALQRIRLAGALHQVAAVKQQRIPGAGIGAQAVHQGFQVGEAAHAAVALRGVLDSRGK